MREETLSCSQGFRMPAMHRVPAPCQAKHLFIVRHISKRDDLGRTDASRLREDLQSRCLRQAMRTEFQQGAARTGSCDCKGSPGGRQSLAWTSAAGLLVASSGAEFLASRHGENCVWNGCTNLGDGFPDDVRGNWELKKDVRFAPSILEFHADRAIGGDDRP